MKTTRLVAEIRQDAAYALRLALRSPGSSAVIVLTLAVAIGANTAIFGVVNSLVFRPLPAVAAAHELVRIRAGEIQMAWANYEDLRRANDVFADLVAHRPFNTALTRGDRPRRFDGQQTSDNFFTALGARPALGRAYAPADTRRDLLVLSHRAWRQHFGSDRSVLGKGIVLAGTSFEVIGVMPADFRGVSPPGPSADFWVGLDPAVSAGLRDRTDSSFEVVGRLKAGVTDDRAEGALQLLARRLRAEHPEIPESFQRTSVLAVSGPGAFEGMARQLMPVFGFLGVLTIASGFVLIIGCANIAGMLIGRASARRQELAMRLALGAGRARLTRQLLTESLMLALVGGMAGVMFAQWLSGAVVIAADFLPLARDLDLDTDHRVLAYALGLTALTAVAFGLTPARHAARLDVASALSDGHAGSTMRQKLRRTLVVAQVALSTALLLWSGLFVRSLSRIHAIDPGFDAHGVLLASISFGRAPTAVDRRLVEELQQRVGGSAGVSSVGIASIVPLAMSGREELEVTKADAPAGTEKQRVLANRLSPGWFATVRIPFVAGRDFTAADRDGSPFTAIVNETLARQFWNGDAVGKRIQHGRRSLEIVGIVRDSKYWTLGETEAPTLYLPLAQGPSAMVTLHARTADVSATTEVVVAEMRRLAPRLAVDIRPMTDALAVAVRPGQIGAAASGAFGIVAILLSALGVYGLVLFSVTQRMREIGVRKALGAGTKDVFLLVMTGVARPTSLGLAIGLGLGILGAMALGAFIVGVSPMDPLALSVAIAIVAGAAGVAAAVPAVTAVRVNPVDTLRFR